MFQIDVGMDSGRPNSPTTKNLNMDHSDGISNAINQTMKAIEATNPSVNGHQAAENIKHSCILVFPLLPVAKLSLHAVRCNAV